MTTPITKDTFEYTYSDDLNEKDGFQRILFNPNRNLQARELTQIQSIIQNQIEKIGKKLFKEGQALTTSPVSKSDYNYVKLANDTDLTSIIEDIANSVPVIVTSSTTQLEVKIIEALAGTDTDPPTIYVSYIDSSSQEGNTSNSRVVSASEELTNTQGVSLFVNDTDPTGFASIATIPEGSFFKAGFFVYAPTQLKVLNKYDTIPTGNIKFDVIQDIVTASDDPKLNDVSNYPIRNQASPGADRYRIRLILSFYPDEARVNSDTPIDPNTIQLARIENGIIINLDNQEDDYGQIIDELFAPRTFDESGNYNVKQPIIHFEEKEKRTGDSSDSSKLELHYTEGKSYINGYEAEIQFPYFLDVDKARDTEIASETIATGSYSNYVVVDLSVGLPPLFTDIKLSSNRIRTQDNDIGTAKIYAIEYESGSGLNALYRFYLADETMDSGHSFNEVKSLRNDTFHAVIADTQGAIRENLTLGSLLFNFPDISRVKSLEDGFENDTDNTIVIQSIRTPSVSNNDRTFTVTALSSETFVSPSKWLMAVDNVPINDFVLQTPSISGNTATFTLQSGIQGNVKVLAYSQIKNSAKKEKTLTPANINPNISSGTLSNGGRTFDLGKIDIFDVVEIRLRSSTGTVYDGDYRIDSGQTDFEYKNGSITIFGLENVNETKVYISFRYFSHSSSGNFFSVDSYNIDSIGGYDKIPSYRKRNGDVVRLSDVMDFRYSNGNYNNIPAENNVINSDVVYYKPKYGKVYMDQSGYMGVKFSDNNQYPNSPDKSLDMYNIKLNGFTFNENDVEIEKIENKLFKMTDFARMEDRIDRLEEFTSLNLLQQSTLNFPIPNSSNIDRLKAGFVADNFSSFLYSDVNNEDGEYRASMDRVNQLLSPSQIKQETRLYFDESEPRNSSVSLVGDSIYLPYTEEVVISQLSQSVPTEKISQFTSQEFLGEIHLSPSSDNWADEERIPARIVTSGDKTPANNQAINWGEQKTNWQGVSNATVRGGQTLDETREGATITTSSNNYEIFSVVKDANYIARVTSIPYMRNKLVYFKATGLRPNTQHFPYFDGVNVLNYVKKETEMRFFAQQNTEYGNTSRHLTHHPEIDVNSITPLISDANGMLYGSFFIPNNSSLSFRTGTREFKLLNVSINRDQNSTSTARTGFVSEGILNTRQSTIESTRSLKASVVTQTVQEGDSRQNNIDNGRAPFGVSGSFGPGGFTPS